MRNDDEGARKTRGRVRTHPPHLGVPPNISITLIYHQQQPMQVATLLPPRQANPSPHSPRASVSLPRNDARILCGRHDGWKQTLCDVFPGNRGGTQLQSICGMGEAPFVLRLA